jgi:hypothetical protein
MVVERKIRFATMVEFKRLYIVVAIFLSICLNAGFAESNNIMWSSRPLTQTVIRSDNTWENVLEMNTTLHLEEEMEVLVSYAVTATAVRRPTNVVGGSDFYSSSISLSGSGKPSFLQFRIVVDDIPFRYSSSHISPGLSLESNTDSATGHTAVRLGAGVHTVYLQWKKIGQGVASWSCSPSAHDGFTSGRSLIVSARHLYMWHTNGDSVARISKEGEWFELPETTLNFTLPHHSTLRFLYSFTVRSDEVELDGGT